MGQIVKVVHINSVFNQGSTGKIGADIHYRLREEGKQSYFFYGRGPLSDHENAIRISSNFEIYKDVFKTRMFNKHSLSNKRNTRKLVERLEYIDPDIIQIHNIHGYYINYEILFKYLKESGRRIVWTLHDQWILSGNAAYFDDEILDWEKPGENKQQILELSNDYPRYLLKKQSRIIAAYENKKKYFNLPNIIFVTPSIWLADNVKKSYLSSNYVEVINNGIDLSVFKPQPGKFPTNKKKVNLLGVANVWDRRKGIEYILRLAKDLPNNYYITLVGLNDKQIKDLPANVKGIKRTSSLNELVALYSEADLFINPTLEDNYPTVNLESQACGTPVITFDTGGSGESVNKQYGFVIEKGNYNQLLKAVKRIGPKNEDVVKSLALYSRKFGNENMLNAYSELYTNIISGEKNEKNSYL